MRGWRRLLLRSAYATALSVLVLAAALGAYLFARDAGPLASAERQTLDWRFQLRGPLPLNDGIVLILVDEASLEALGGWPLRRGALARALARLTAAGPRAVAIDILFTQSGGENDPEGDRALARAITLSAPLVLPLAFRFEAQSRAEPPPGLTRAAFRIVRVPEGARPTMRFQPTDVLAPPERYLAQASAGHVNLFPGGSDIVRTVHLAIPYGDRFYPALAVELARLHWRVEADDMAAFIGEGVRLGERFVETDGAMRVPINYRGNAGGFPVFTLLALVEGRVPPAALEERVVLIGVSATGLGDSFATPFGARMPGVALLATITDNILEDRFLRAGPTAQAIDLGVLLVAGGLLLWPIQRRRFGVAVLVAGLFLAAWLAAVQFAFAEMRLVLNATIPSLAFLLLGGVALFGLAGREHGERHRAEARGQALGRYVSPLVERHIERGGAQAETVNAVAMFVDMRGFTQASEANTPDEVAARLRKFHGRVARTVAAHGGVVDKYLGDGVLIVFGAEGAGPAEAAAALACARALAGPDPESGEIEALGVGLHAGPVVIGELGGAERSEVSVAGDAVNVASRLQDIAKQANVAIAASDSVVGPARQADPKTVAGFELRPGQEIRGRAQPLDIWLWRGGG